MADGPEGADRADPAGRPQVPEPAAVAEPERLVVGHVSKPHGNRGEVFVWPLTDRPEEVFATGRSLLLGDEEGEVEDGAPELVVEASRAFKRGMLVRLRGVESRESAEALARRYLLAPLEVLDPLAEGEVFYHQLLGAVVDTIAGERVGTVREVYETEPAHLLEVESPEGRRHLIPFTERVVRLVDREGRRVVIDPPAGLLEI